MYCVVFGASSDGLQDDPGVMGGGVDVLVGAMVCLVRGSRLIIVRFHRQRVLYNVKGRVLARMASKISSVFKSSSHYHDILRTLVSFERSMCFGIVTYVLNL